MNKRKRVAWAKHRKAKQKADAKKRAARAAPPGGRQPATATASA